MQKLLSLLLLLTMPVISIAQDFRYRIGATPTDNFFQICIKADAWYANNLQGPVAPQRLTTRFTDNEFTAYQRWKWYWHTRVDENGNFPDLVAMRAETNNARQQEPSTLSATWSCISQTSAIGGYNGMGRTTCVAFHPTNPNEFYVGAPIGGLWKTTDAGATWTPLTDQLPYVSVGSCLIDPSNPATIYISVGDHSGWWNYSLGVYKSVDGGANWAPTGLSWTLSQGRAIAKIEMDPTNPQVIYAATTAGLYKTIDGGATWSVVQTGDHSDIEFEPGTSNVYTAKYDYWGSSEVYRSTDGGVTWNQLTTFAQQYNYIRIAVTPAAPAKLVVQCSMGNHPVYTSNNYGATLTYASDSPEDAIIFISPTNPNQIYTGYMHVYQSQDNAATWYMLTYWYYNPPYDEVHADQHNVFFHPLNPNLLYFCNDGGLYTFDESTFTWNNISDGLIITQFYKIAVSQSDPMMMIGGTQDNGGRLRTSNGMWRSTNGGDAMEVAIDPTDDDVIYTTYVNGLLYRSLDRWIADTYHEISTNIPGGTPPGSWVAPYMIDPSDPNTIVAGYDDVWRSTDRGDNWTQLSTNITGNGSTLEQLTVAPSDPNTIYVSRGASMWGTHDLGATWNPITIPGTAGITSITVHPANPNQLWITRGGYNAGSKVYTSVNGGGTWLNISIGLPNTTINTSVFEIGSDNLIYIGTDAGVYARDTLTNVWQSYSAGLPYTAVTDLQIYYPTRKLRASTFGRGIWEVDLVNPLSVQDQNGHETASMKLFPNPVNDVVQLNYTSSSTSSIEVKICNVLGEVVSDFTEPATSELRKSIDVSHLAAGYYSVAVIQDNKMITRPLVVR